MEKVSFTTSTASIPLQLEIARTDLKIWQFVLTHLNLHAYLLVAKNWNPGATFKQSPRPGISNSFFSRRGIRTEIWGRRETLWSVLFLGGETLTNILASHTQSIYEMLIQWASLHCQQHLFLQTELLSDTKRNHWVSISFIQ